MKVDAAPGNGEFGTVHPFEKTSPNRIVNFDGHSSVALGIGTGIGSLISDLVPQFDCTSFLWSFSVLLLAMAKDSNTSANVGPSSFSSGTFCTR